MRSLFPIPLTTRMARIDERLIAIARGDVEPDDGRTATPPAVEKEPSSWLDRGVEPEPFSWKPPI